LHGIDALGESASTAVDPQLLMQTMEIRCVRLALDNLNVRMWFDTILGQLLFFVDREEIDEAETIEALDTLRKQISEQIDAIITKLGQVYDKQQDLDATKKYAVELQYMVKCAEEIDAKEEKLEATGAK
jgi:DnaJ-domain-containing protein 1